MTNVRESWTMDNENKLSHLTVSVCQLNARLVVLNGYTGHITLIIPSCKPGSSLTYLGLQVSKWCRSFVVLHVDP